MHRCVYFLPIQSSLPVEPKGVAALPFLSAFDGFARLSFGRIRDVAGIALIHVEHAERTSPVCIGVLDGQEMLFCLAEQEQRRNQNPRRTGAWKSFRKAGSLSCRMGSLR